VRFRHPTLWAALLTAGAAAFPGSAEAADQELARQGYAFLKSYCHRCHGVEFKVPRYNVLDRDFLVAGRGRGKMPYVTPGKPERSEIWRHVAVDEDMPPSGQRQPSAAEKRLLKQWIEAGAPFPRTERPRPFRGEKDVLAAIRDHLKNRVPPEARRFQRYFTLNHLHSDRGVREEDLRLYRAALAKLVNSLSWQARLADLRAIDRDETVLAIDLRDLGWNRQPDPWRAILKAHPYGLSHRRSSDRAMRQLAEEVGDLSDTSLAHVRADWFIATASRPPLYHTLLQLPRHAETLERRLGVNVRDNFLGNRLARAGLTTSGVSRHNRLVERHPALGTGYYWKSYDFASSEGRGDLLRYPLGPAFAEHPFPGDAFRHGGGEIIFNLPNGLQGYLLVDGDGKRLDAGPVRIVRDSQETAGTPAIVNGLSCMACHKHGPIDGFRDVVRTGTVVARKARARVEKLYPAPEVMDRLLRKDQASFLRALEQTMGPFLQVGEDRKKAIHAFPEPIGAVARRYFKDIGLEEAARELDFSDPQELCRHIRKNARLRRLGLGPLADGARIKRELWESLQKPHSLFHKAAAELGRGAPFRLRE
jgi:serine/threonine-protein kinase